MTSLVVNRAQGYSLNLVVEHEGVVEQLRSQLAQAQLDAIRAAGGQGTWAETALAQAITTGVTYTY